MFYNVLPQKPVNRKEFLKFVFRCITPGTLVFVVLLTVIATLCGMAFPAVTNIVFQRVIPSGKTDALMALVTLLLGITISGSIFKVMKTMLTFKLQTQMSIPLLGALMARLLSLPTEFFNRYQSGDISNRLTTITQFCIDCVTVILVTGLSTLRSTASWIRSALKASLILSI